MIIKKIQQLKAKKGFTLVELLVVIAIIGILAAVLIPLMSAFLNNARISNAESTANQLATAIQTPLSHLMGRATQNKPEVGHLSVFVGFFDTSLTPPAWNVARVGTVIPDPSAWTNANAEAIVRDALNDSFPNERIGAFLIRIAREAGNWEADGYVTVAYIPDENRAFATADAARQYVGVHADGRGVTALPRVDGTGTDPILRPTGRNNAHFNGVNNGRATTTGANVPNRVIVGCFPPQ